MKPGARVQGVFVDNTAKSACRHESSGFFDSSAKPQNPADENGLYWTPEVLSMYCKLICHSTELDTFVVLDILRRNL